jgi:putative transposase
MPRRKRGWLDGACYHITHRCNNQEFLFHYKKYRQFYQRQLFEMRKRYRVDILNYVVTSNHIHLLVTARKGKNISAGLGYLHGRVAQYYNLENKKHGAFWSDRFSSTLIQDGKYLGKCLFYIDLNMIRAGAVNHPSKWDACGYNEFYNPKQRCRIINIDKLLQVLAIPDVERFKQWHTLTLDSLISKTDLKRVEFWSKAYAVGDEEWLKEKLALGGIKRMKIKNSNDCSFAIGEKP